MYIEGHYQPIMVYNFVSNIDTNQYNVYFNWCNSNVRILYVIHIFVIFKRFNVPHIMTQDALQHNQNSHTLDPEHIDGNQPHLII
jgi:hypothetical protein